MTTKETTKNITEFRLYPTTEQAAKIDLWLTQLKWVWNTGLSLLEEDQQRYWRVKQEWIEPSPETWQWRKSCKIGGIEYVNPDNQYGLCCAYYPDKCDIRKHQDIQELFKHVKNYRFIANMRCPDFLHSIDGESRRSVVDSLIDAWTQYRKRKKGRPRYKGKADRLESFSNGNGRTLVSILPLGNDNTLINYPKLGQIKCKGFYRRYAGNHTIVRVIKKADGYYVQFTSTVDVKPAKLAKKDEVGLDFGVIAPIADSDGRLHKSKRYAKLQAKKLARIQRSISRSKDGSNRLKAKRSKLAKIHLKISRQRDRFIHKLTSKYVSEYQSIAIEDTKVKQMTGKAKPKPDGKGGYLPNGAAAKAGLNKALLDVAIGKTKTMLETKSKASERIFVKVPAPHTSQGCSQCGYYSEKFRPSQAVFKCLNCGHGDNADNNASTVIRNVAFKGLVLKPYSASSEEVKDVDHASHGKKRQPSKARKSKKGSGGETSPAINRESGIDRLIPIHVNPVKLAPQDFELWQDLKSLSKAVTKLQSRKRSSQIDPSIGSQLGFWDLADTTGS
jgi:putative transposase